jgi:hypothetical protein
MKHYGDDAVSVVRRQAGKSSCLLESHAGCILNSLQDQAKERRHKTNELATTGLSVESTR